MLTVYPANPTLPLLHLSALRLTMRHELISSSFQMEKRRHRLTQHMRSLQRNEVITGQDREASESWQGEQAGGGRGSGE